MEKAKGPTGPAMAGDALPGYDPAVELSEVIDFFGALAPTWDERAVHDAGRLSRVLDACGVREGDVVLDVACGTGFLAPELFARGAARVVGVDVSGGMVRAARERWAEEPRAEFLLGDACAMGLPAATCAVVFNAIPHFADPAALFANVARALPASGRLTVCHDWSRERIDGLHHGAAPHVSRGLMPAVGMAHLMAGAGFAVDVIEDDDVYVVSGCRR